MANRKHGTNFWPTGSVSGFAHWKRRNASRSPSPEDPSRPHEKQGAAPRALPAITVGWNELINTDKVLLTTQCFPTLAPGVGLKGEVMDRVWSNMAILRERGVSSKTLEREYYKFFLKKSGGLYELHSLVERLARFPLEVLSKKAAIEEAGMMLVYYCAQLEELEKEKSSHVFGKMLSYDPDTIVKDAIMTAEACHNLPQLQLDEVLRLFVANPIDIKEDYELSFGRLEGALEMFEGVGRIAAHNLTQLNLLSRPMFDLPIGVSLLQRKPDVLCADKKTLRKIIYLLFMALSSTVWMNAGLLRFRDRGRGRARWTRFIAAAHHTKYYDDMHAFSEPSTIFVLVCALADGCMVTSQPLQAAHKQF